MIYISGAMSGIKDYNYPEFNRVAHSLRALGHEVFNPAEIKIDTTGMNKDDIWQAYMDVCIPAVEKCSMIYMLNGWEKSKGAKKELNKAFDLGLEIKYQGDIIGHS
jgi:hypothetical protein